MCKINNCDIFKREKLRVNIELIMNVMLIVVDSLRHDNSKILERQLEKFGFYSYSNVISPASWTTPSHASIFTGLYPSSHSVHEKGLNNSWINYILNSKAKSYLFTKTLKRLGYKLFLISANPLISRLFGYDNFDEYLEINRLKGFIFRLSVEDDRRLRMLMTKYRSKVKVFSYLLKRGEIGFLAKSCLYSLSKRIWNYFIPFRYLYSLFTRWPLEKGSNNIVNYVRHRVLYDRTDRKFVFINFMEVHEPYLLDMSFSKEAAKSFKNQSVNTKKFSLWKRKYSEACNYISNKVSDLLQTMEEANLLDKYLIIITSDHGQLLGEYSKVGHGYYLYDELLKVPLFIRYPKQIEESISLMDHPSQERYISLVKLKPFIIQFLGNSNERYTDKILYTTATFAESFGIHIDLKFKSEKEIERVEKSVRYRIAVYHNGYKAVFKVSKLKTLELDHEFLDKKYHKLLSDGELRKIQDTAYKFIKIRKLLAKVGSINISSTLSH